MKYQNPIEKYYGSKKYQFRNISHDDGSAVIIQIDPTQINIQEKTYYGKQTMVVDFNKLADNKSISKTVREITNDFVNVKHPLTHGRMYFNKVKKDFNALHFKCLSTCVTDDCISNIIIDPIKI